MKASEGGGRAEVRLGRWIDGGAAFLGHPGRPVRSSGEQFPLDLPRLSLRFDFSPLNMDSSFEAAHVHTVYNEIALDFSRTRHSRWPFVQRFLDQLPAVRSSPSSAVASTLTSSTRAGEYRT